MADDPSPREHPPPAPAAVGAVQAGDGGPRRRWDRLIAWAEARVPRVVAGLVVSSASAASLLVGGGAWAWLLASERDEAVAIAHAAEVDLARAEVELAARRAEGGEVAEARSDLAVAAQRFLRADADAGPALLSLSALDDAHPPPELSIPVVGAEEPALLFSPDGRELAVHDDVVRIIGLPLGEVRARWVPPAGADTFLVSWTPGGPRAATWLGTRLELWDVRSGASVASFEAPEWAEGASVALSGDGAVIGFSTPEGGTRFAFVDTGLEAGPPLRHSIVSLDATGERAVVRPYRSQATPSYFHLLLYQRDNGRELTFFPEGAWDLSQDGKLLVQRTRTELRALEPVKGEPRWALPQSTFPVPRLTGGDQQVTTVDREQRLRRLSAEDGSVLLERVVQAGTTASRESVAASPDGRWVAIAAPGSVPVFAVFDHDRVREEAHRTTPIFGLDLTTDGELLVTVGWDGWLRVWDWRSRSILRQVYLSSHGARAVALTSTGTRAVAGDRTGVVRVVDLRSGEVEHTLVGRGLGSVRDIEVLPGDAEALVLYERGALVRWDLEAGLERSREQVQSLQPHSLARSPLGRLVVTSMGAGPMAEIRDGQDTRPVGEGSSFRAAWSRDGALAIAGEDGCVHVLVSATAERGESEAKWACGEDVITAVAWSDAGDLLAVGDYQGRVRVLDAVGGEVATGWAPHAAGVQDVAFVPGQRVVVAAGSDGALSFLDLGLTEEGAPRLHPLEAGEPVSVYRWRERFEQARLRGDWQGVVEAAEALEQGGTAPPELDVVRALWATGRQAEAVERLGRSPPGYVNPGTVEVWWTAQGP